MILLANSAMVTTVARHVGPARADCRGQSPFLYCFTMQLLLYIAINSVKPLGHGGWDSPAVSTPKKQNSHTGEEMKSPQAPARICAISPADLDEPKQKMGKELWECQA